MSDQPKKKKFVYSPFENMASEAQINPAPLWPQGSHESDLSKMMNQAKARNDDTFWDTMRTVLAHDVATLPLHRFKVWASVLTVPLVSRYRFKDYIAPVLHWAQAAPLTTTSNWDILKDPGVGALPEDLAILNIFDDYPCTMNRVQMMAHLLLTGWAHRLDNISSIIEFGAGIGEMTDVIYKLGYKGSYNIYDFPELHAIQRYHHEQLGYKEISYITEDGLKSAMEMDWPAKIDLGIATFSITEMPMDLRKRLLDTIHCDNWLIAYSRKIFGFDNEKWIKEEFVPRFTDHHVKFIDKKFHTWDGGSSYLVIRKKT